MSAEQKYCVAAQNYGGEDQGAWFQEPHLGNTSRRSECHEHTASEAIKTIAKDYDRETCRIYRAEGVLADALAELQREADTADHARPEPPTAHVYDVHSPGNPVVTCLAADLPRTVGDIQKTGRPSRVSARLPRCEPSTVDALDGVVREPIEDETTRQYPALRLVTGEGV